MRKIILAAILAAAAFGGNFEQATKIYLKKSDFENGARLFEKSCNDDKNAAGCYMAAFLGEQNGKFSDEDGGKKAFALYEKACGLGDMDGCTAVAGAYDGNALWGVVESDYEKAAGLYEKACEGGVGEACVRAAAHGNGEYGGTKDPQKACKYYRLACDYEDAQGCYALARGYEKADQGVKDDKKAMDLYGLSCDYGYDMGCAKFRELVKKSK
nr:tetratricopeptide repeat protein [uncultured Campylobacter sp.]